MGDRFHQPLPEELRDLADRLASLSRRDQEAVVRAARSRQNLQTIPWGELWKASGVVRLGGHAVEDCDALYDDA